MSDTMYYYNYSTHRVGECPKDTFCEVAAKHDAPLVGFTDWSLAAEYWRERERKFCRELEALYAKQGYTAMAKMFKDLLDRFDNKMSPRVE